MQKFSFSETYKLAAKEYGLGKGEYLKIKNGDNRFRLLSEVVPHASEYQGRPTFKWVCWVLDRTDNTVKPYFMPNTIYQTIQALQLSEDYAFDSVPMPYDITVQAKNASTKDVVYQVIPSPKIVPLTDEEQKAFSERLPIKEFVTKLDKNPRQEKVEYQQPKPHEIITEEDPFASVEF